MAPGTSSDETLPKEDLHLRTERGDNAGFASNELFYAGVDPNDMRFKRAACFDVGVQCGGWGRIVLELSVQDRKDA